MRRTVELIYLVKNVEMAWRRPFLDTVAGHGLNFAQYTAMSVLRRRPGLTSSELARRSFVRAQTMATTLQPLHDAGFVSREQDPEHGRQILLYITDAGIAKIEAINPDVEALERELTAAFTDDEAAEFARLLRKARSTMLPREAAARAVAEAASV